MTVPSSPSRDAPSWSPCSALISASFLDGAKDVILAPLSLLTGCIALMLPSHRAPSPLRFLVRTARRLDDAIDLCDLPELRRASPTPVALPAARDGRDPTDLATSLAGSGDPSAVHEA